jgi:hypothetical protein
MNSYIATERMLSDVLRMVPYCKEHENVWSPTLVTVILEACSQLDSLWKYQAKQSPYVKKKELNIKDYFIYFGEIVSSRRVIFWAEKAELITPYDKWTNVGEYNPANYQKLDWWDTNTKLKHDRLSNRSEATLRYAIQSLAGLFIAMIRCEFCLDGIVQEGWVSANHPNLQACLFDDSSDSYLHYCVAESKLFAYPVGFDKIKITPDFNWYGPASPRFKNWFDQNSSGVL